MMKAPLIAAVLAVGTLCRAQPSATEGAVRFDEARLLVERVPSKKLVVADNLVWLKEGRIPSYAEGNVVRWLELKGEDMSAYRKDHVLSDPDLGEPLAKRRGFRLGYMLDISRGRVPTMPMLKVYVDVLAACGFNEFQLYTEHVFAYRDHRTAWKDSDPMTAEEVRELDDYAWSKGVRLVPNQNSFGHLEKWFRHPEYLPLAEAPNGYRIESPRVSGSPHALAASAPESLAFLGGLYDELLPNFRHAKTLNVGCDEVWDVFDANCRSAARGRAVGPANVYMDHVLDVHRLVSARGWKTAFWGDMVLRHPELLARVPQDAEVLLWGYSSEMKCKGYSREFFGRAQALQRRHLAFTTCPAAATCGRPRPYDYREWAANIALADEAARRFGGASMLVTEWGTTPLSAVLPAIVCAGRLSRGEPADEASVAADVARLRGPADAPPFWVAAGDAMIDLERRAAELRAGKGRRTPVPLAKAYRELWTKINRPGGLEESVQNLAYADAIDYDNADLQICSKSQPAGFYPPCRNCSLAAGNPTLRRHVEAIRAADGKANAEWDAATSEADVARLRTRLRADFLKAIGGLPDRTPLNARTTGVVPRAGYRIEKIVFESQPRHFVTAHLFLPDGVSAGNRAPGLLVPCGHSPDGKLSAKYQRLGVLAAQAGLVALVYDPIDQGERWQGKGPCLPVSGHVGVGLRAHLLGWNMARFRIWDGIRALDCLAARPEVDASRIGVAGQSGGGTLSTYLYFLDDRLKAAAPAGFITSMSRLAEHWGPQDCEQIVPGQAPLGLNHTAFLAARAPSPVCLVLAEQDAFPIDGSDDTLAHLRSLYGRLGHPDRVARASAPGLHGYREATLRATVDFMRRWLKDEGPCAFGPEGDNGLSGDPQGFVVPNGRVDALPGYRSSADLLREELAAAVRARKPLARALVQEVTGIDVSVTTVPEEDYSFAGRTAYWTRFHSPEAEIAAFDVWLGTSFVRERAEAMIAAARAHRKAKGEPMPLKVSGADVVAAVHAKYLVPELFGPLEISDPPPSWRAAFDDVWSALPITTVVHGALRHYDWTDLRTALRD